jgi:hypothetical protein
MTNPWAPKSAYDERDAPAVTQARRWHAALYAMLFLLGMGFGYLVFELLGSPFRSTHDRLLAGGILMVVFGGIAGELGNALWLLICHGRLRLSAEEASAALRAPSIPSFVLARLYERLYERKP